jgi:hypothetical protein
VKVNPHRGRAVEAVIKAVTTDQKGRVRLQVEFGKDKKAFVYDWQGSRSRFHGKGTFTRFATGVGGFVQHLVGFVH